MYSSGMVLFLFSFNVAISLIKYPQISILSLFGCKVNTIFEQKTRGRKDKNVHYYSTKPSSFVQSRKKFTFKMKNVKKYIDFFFQM